MGSTISIPNMSRSVPGQFITNTGWLKYCIAKDYLKPGDLYQSCDILRHDQPTPDRAPSFSVCYVGVNEAFVKLWIYLSAAKQLCLKISQRN